MWSQKKRDNWAKWWKTKIESRKIGMKKGFRYLTDEEFKDENYC